MKENWFHYYFSWILSITVIFTFFKKRLRNAKKIRKYWILVRRNLTPRGTCSQFIVILKSHVQYFSLWLSWGAAVPHSSGLKTGRIWFESYHPRTHGTRTQASASERKKVNWEEGLFRSYLLKDLDSTQNSFQNTLSQLTNCNTINGQALEELSLSLSKEFSNETENKVKLRC